MTLSTRVKTIAHWADGKSFAGSGDRTSSVTNPATGQVTGELALADVADARVVIDAAAAAYPAWRDTSLAKRTTILFAFRELLNARKGELAEIITSEHGKVVSDALGEVSRGQEVVEFACGIAHLLKGGMTENASTNVDVASIRQPLGVVGIISPFNFPAMVPMWFFPIAIAAGNTVVLKPSEKDPSAALWLAELWAEAGLPAGVFNVLQGDKVAVDELLTNPSVKAISFVGSTPIAQYVYSTGTLHGKLGIRAGNTGLINLDDVPVPIGNRIGEEGEGFLVAMSAIDQGRFTVAAGAVGLAQACVDASVRYAHERQTFGQEIGEHQLVKQMLANMAKGTEIGRLLVLQAAWLKNQGLRNTRETSLAKWHATDHSVQAALDAIQIHGANGYSNEFPVERYLRNSKAAVIYEGTSQLHTLIQADYALGYRHDRPLRCEPWPAQGFERPTA
jgi:hypothetical protein